MEHREGGSGLGMENRERERDFTFSLRSPKKTLAAKDDDKMSEEEGMLNDSLPEVLIADILSRLPVKSLLRFRCVCKLWCALIANPAFVKMHLTRSIASNRNLSLIVEDTNLYSADVDFCEPRPAVELNHPLKSPRCRTVVLGYCNGLFFLSSKSNLNNPDVLYLWNPSTRRHQKLPFTPIEDPGKNCYCRGTVYGFGQDPTTDDYKVVRVVQFDGDCDAEVKVYSLYTNSWRRIGNMPFHLSNIHGFGFLANSVLHWHGHRGTNSNFIVSFDLKDEKYGKVPLPDFMGDKFELSVGVFGGQLCVLFSFSNVGVDIWVMKDYGVKDSWAKQFSMEKPTSFFGRPICYSKNGRVILEKDSKTLILFDPDNGRFRYLRTRGVPRKDHRILGVPVSTCLGNLVPLNAKDGIEQVERKEKEHTAVVPPKAKDGTEQERKEKEHTAEAMRAKQYAQEIRELRAENTELKKMLSQQEQTLSQQEQTLSQQEQTFSQQEQTLSQQEQMLSEQEQMLSEQEQMLSQQVQKLAKMKSQMQVLKQMMQSRTSRS